MSDEIGDLHRMSHGWVVDKCLAIWLPVAKMFLSDVNGEPAPDVSRLHYR
jgi:hypothetical protein